VQVGMHVCMPVAISFAFFSSSDDVEVVGCRERIGDERREREMKPRQERACVPSLCLEYLTATQSIDCMDAFS
jgi:hypothetical protein